MRTVFHALETDHLDIHADLAGLYNTWQPYDPLTLGKAAVLDARDFGLADGATSDGQAMQDALDAAGALRQWGDRSIAGVRLQFPPGAFMPTAQYGNPIAPSVPLKLNAPTGQGGFIILEGSTAGGTSFNAPDNGMGAGQTTVTGTTVRGNGGTDASGANAPINVFTVTATNHRLALGDPIVFRLTSRANPKNFVSQIVLAVIDANTFTYVMGDPGDANLDLLKVTNGATIDKLEYLLEPLDFGQQEVCIIRDIAFNGPAWTSGDPYGLNNFRIGDPNNLPSPQIGYAVRSTSRVNFERCLFQNWWGALVHNGAARGTQGAQNTDHMHAFRCQFISNVDNRLFLYNQRFNIQSVPTVIPGPAIGGSRDQVFRDCNYGTTARATVAISDSGTYQSGILDDIGHDKSSPYPIFIEGVQPVKPLIQPKLSLISGTWKNESPGTTAICWDESRKSTWDQSKVHIRSQVSIAVNGGPGNKNTSSHTPWTVTTSVAAGVQTVVLPAGHGIRVGDHLCVGSGVTVGNNYVAGAGDGASIVGTLSTNTVTMLRPDLDARSGTDAIITGGTNLASASANWSDLDTGRVITCTGVPAGTTITFVDNTNVTLSAVSTNGTGLSWSIPALTISSYTATAGLICGFRIGYVDNVHLRWQSGVSSSGNSMALSAFWWNFNQEPNCFVVDYETNDGRGSAALGDQLPSWTIETANAAGTANRSVVTRGTQRFVPMLHDPGDAVTTGGGAVFEYSTSGMVKLSTGVKTLTLAGIAMQPSSASGGVSVATDGKIVYARRPYLMVAEPGTVLPSHDGPTTAVVSGSPPSGVSATVADGAQIVDAKDGGVGAWDGSTTGLRRLGVAIAAKAGGFVALKTTPERFT